MHWRLKALTQNVVAQLPPQLSHAVYFHLQRRFGGLRSANPNRVVRAALEIAQAIRRNGRQLTDAVCLEVGTGHTVTLPIVLWLLGARRVITVDLHRYLKAELVAADVAYLQSHADELLKSLAGCDLRSDRFRQLMEVSIPTNGLSEFLQSCGLQYLAPADAGRLPLDDGVVDFHISTNVFEHIPPDVLATILREAGRVLCGDGLAIHRVDHSDHFSHSDRALSPINFLRYGEREWARLAGNRYMYMNRLQVDDFQRIFAGSGHVVLDLAAGPDESVLRQLHASPPPLDSRFAGKSLDTLATMISLFVSRPLRESAAVVREQAA